ncbi:MAG: SRPBCC family protein [Methanoregulaceae archaeon]|nr:SRPBCC family protein [Methanoregulaceae archaeon]
MFQEVPAEKLFSFYVVTSVPVVRYESVLPCSPDAVWAFHASPSALERLTPPEQNLESATSEGGGAGLPLVDGALHVLRFRLGPFRMEWRARISEVDPPHGFTDTAEKSPFKSWRHRHGFLPHEGGCLLVDEIEYELPFGILGRIAEPFVRRDVDRLFAFRHRETLKHVDGPGETPEPS